MKKDKPKNIRPLTDVEFDYLEWKANFPNFNLIRIRTPMDGSCLFHALCKAYFKPYINGQLSGEAFDKDEFIKNLRKELSKKLAQKIDGKTFYQKLGKGELAKTAESMSEYSLENMQKDLANSHKALSVIYNEFISDQLDKDIYILNAKTKDVYLTGTEDNILYKNRKSVVLLYLPKYHHYELIGIMHNNNNVETYFESDSNFIKHIRNRMSNLRLNHS